MTEPVGGTGQGMKLHTKILLGLILGGIAGLVANVGLGSTDPFVTGVNTYLAQPVGQIFLNLLFMIVIPLVFASISLGVAGLGDLRVAGRVGGTAIGYFLVTTALSATLGLVLVRVVRPGSGLSAAVRAELLHTYAGDAAAKVQAAATSTFGIQTLVNVVTRNPVKSAVDLDLLGVIFFSLIFGAAITMIRADRAKTMIAWLEALNDIVIKIVEIAMRLAPYGVAGLIFGVTSRFGLALLKPLGT
jgi:DAACS family dicarboxylate/amino acid:cation (Na+ or H+) symporter